MCYYIGYYKFSKNLKKFEKKLKEKFSKKNFQKKISKN